MRLVDIVGALFSARKVIWGVCVWRVGLLWQSRAGACPNLPQRRPGPGSTANRSTEYQRFSSGISARSGPLWQIWTIRRLGPVGEGVRGAGGGPGARLDEPSGPVGPAGASVRERPRRPDRSRGSRPSPGPAGTPLFFRERVGFQSNAQMGGARSTGNLRVRGKTARGERRAGGRRTGRRTRPPRRPRPLPTRKIRPTRTPPE